MKHPLHLAKPAAVSQDIGVMFQTNMVAHLWDLVDEGLESVLDLLQGRIGVSGLCTPVIGGPVQHLRYAAQVSPRLFQSCGGLFFQPDRSLYDRTRCKPLVCEWLKARNPLEKLAAECRQRGLGLRAVIECIHFGRLATHDPHFARKNVFGDVSSSQRCLMNPDVTEFFRAAVTDLCRNYGLDTVELTGLDAMSIAADPSDDLGPGGRQLLALCFCESCRQAAATAGVDVHAAARSTTVRLEAVFRTGRPVDRPLTVLAAEDPPLAAFLAWYGDRIAAFSEGLQEASGCRVVSHTRLPGPQTEGDVDLGHTYKVDTVVGDYLAWETAPLEHWIARLRSVLTEAQRLEVQLPVHSPGEGEDPALVRNLTRVAELGIPSANLEHYGRLPRERFETVKQAVRFARRTAG